MATWPRSAVDITISHPAQSSETPFTAEKARQFLKRKEAEKHDKYDEPCRLQRWDFQTLAFNTWGSLGPQSKPLLNRIIQRCSNAARPNLRGTVQDEIHQRISLALMRQIWHQLAPGSTFWQ